MYQGYRALMHTKTKIWNIYEIFSIDLEWIASAFVASVSFVNISLKCRQSVLLLIKQKEEGAAKWLFAEVDSIMHLPHI